MKKLKNKNWRKIKLRDWIELKYGFGLPGRNRIKGSVPVYGSSGVVGWHNESMVDENGIIVGRKGNVGAVYFSETPFYPIDTVYFIDSLKKNGSLRFFYYLLKTIDFQKIGISTGVPGLNRDTVYSLKILISENLREQKHISNILSAYDDLIEVNNKKIKNLEEMTQIIYNGWFIKFRFPGYEKAKFKNGIPEEWGRKNIEDVIQNIKTKYVDSEHKNLSLLDLKRIPRKSLIVNSYGLSNEIKTVRKIFSKYDILFGNIRAYFHKIVFAVKCGITNSSVFVFRARNPIYQDFFFNYFFSEDVVSWAVQNSGGTKMPVIGWNVFKVKKILLPTEDIVKKFNYIIQPMMDNIINLNLQNEKLRKTRDLLLPKLMSGEIKV